MVSKEETAIVGDGAALNFRVSQGLWILDAFDNFELGIENHHFGMRCVLRGDDL